MTDEERMECLVRLTQSDKRHEELMGSLSERIVKTDERIAKSKELVALMKELIQTTNEKLKGMDDNKYSLPSLLEEDKGC